MNILNLFKQSFLAKTIIILAVMLTGGANFAWAQKPLPYSYGFEDNNLATDGWTIIDPISSSTCIVKTGTYTQVRTNDYSFRFYSGYNKTEYLVSPLLESSSTGIEFSFYYKNATTYSKETFYVGYSTTEGEGEPQASSFTWLEDALVPAASMSDFEKYSATINNTSVKYVAIKHVSANSHNVFIDDVTIEPTETYKRPKFLNVSSYTSTTATLSWTNGSDETQWQIAYSLKENFDSDTEGVKVAVTSNPYTLTGLTDGATYYAYVRSNYSGNYSEWSNKIQFTAANDGLFDGSNTSDTYIPINGSRTNAITQSQYIIPASYLESMQNRYITKLTFYTTQSSISWGDAKFEVYLKETANTKFANASFDADWGSKVFNSAKLSVTDGKMVVELNSPFYYTNSNLMIGFKQTATGSTSATTWYNFYDNWGASVYSYDGGSTVSKAYYRPKVTITTTSSTTLVTIGSNGYTTFACPRPLDLRSENLPSGLKAYKATVDAVNSKVRFTEIDQTVPVNTGVLLAGASTNYNIPVAASGTPLGSNDFLVNCDGGTFQADDDYTYFAMKKDIYPLIFGTFNPSTTAIPSNKAYLKVLTDDLPKGSGARTLRFVFDDNETTGIKNVDAQKTSNKDIYFNLNGQRVAKPTKGMYISNGKKYIVK